MDDIKVKAELAVLCGPKVEVQDRVDVAGSGGEVPHEDQATTPNNGIKITNVVSMASATKSEVVLPDVVGSAVHAVIELEPDELPASAAPGTVSGGMCPTGEPLDFSVGSKQGHGHHHHPMAAVEASNPVSVAQHEASVTGVVGPRVAILSNGDPAAVKAEHEPSPEVVDLTEDPPSSPSSPSTPLPDELCESEEKPVELGEGVTTDGPLSSQGSSPETDFYVNLVTARTKPVSPSSSVTADTSESAAAIADEENFRGFLESDIAKAKKRSSRFAEFLRKYGGVGKQRRKSKSCNSKRRWFDGCQYRCGFCDLTFSQTNMLRNHVRGRHEREFSFRDHQTLKQSQWRCRVCTFIFMRERAVIEEHLMESHGLTIQGYEGGRRRKRSDGGGGGGDGSKCVENSPGDDDDSGDFRENRQTGRQIESEANAVDEVGSNIVTEESVDKNKVPIEASKKPMKTNNSGEPKAAAKESNASVPKGHQEIKVKEEMTGDRPWFDGCTFQCPICPGLFRLTSSIVRHMKSAHDSSFVHSKVELAEVSYWKCEICKGATFMKRMRMDIKYHLKMRHNMSLSDYEREFLSETRGIAREKPSIEAMKSPSLAGGSGESDIAASEGKRAVAGKGTGEVEKTKTEKPPLLGKTKEGTERKRSGRSGRGRPKKKGEVQIELLNHCLPEFFDTFALFSVTAAQGGPRGAALRHRRSCHKEEPSSGMINRQSFTSLILLCSFIIKQWKKVFVNCTADSQTDAGRHQL